MTLSHDDLTSILLFAQHASPPPVSVIQFSDNVTPLDWIADALAMTAGQSVYGVVLGTPEAVEEGAAIFCAITGNGAHALANANFYMLCHTAVPLLVAEVQRLRALHAEDTP